MVGTQTGRESKDRIEECHDGSREEEKMELTFDQRNTSIWDGQSKKKGSSKTCLTEKESEKLTTFEVASTGHVPFGEAAMSPDFPRSPQQKFGI